jgi:hypothetical protein
MKIEHERDEGYRRWTVEVDRWVERALIGLPFALVGTWSVLLGPLRTLLGG